MPPFDLHHDPRTSFCNRQTALWSTSVASSEMTNVYRRERKTRSLLALSPFRPREARAAPLPELNSAHRAMRALETGLNSAAR
jgi:hypothetical protein